MDVIFTPAGMEDQLAKLLVRQVDATDYSTGHLGSLDAGLRNLTQVVAVLMARLARSGRLSCEDIRIVLNTPSGGVCFKDVESVSVEAEKLDEETRDDLARVVPTEGPV